MEEENGRRYVMVEGRQIRERTVEKIGKMEEVKEQEKEME